MKLCLKTLATATTAASMYFLTGCAAPPSFSYQNVSIAITSFCSDCAGGALTPTYNPAYPQPPNPGSVALVPSTGQGITTTFVATVTNAPSNVTWTIYPTPNLTDITQLPTGTSTPVGETGTFGTVNAQSGNTIYYTVPGPPVYSGAALLQANALGIPQGDILLVASVPASPSNPNQVATANQLIQVYDGSSSLGPPSTYLTPKSGTNPAGQTQPVITVPHNTSYAFYGGTIGSPPCTPPTGQTKCVGGSTNGDPADTVDNSSIWLVGPTPFSLSTAVVGGNATFGTITPQGVYTAPANIPTSTNSTTTISGEVVVMVTPNSDSTASDTSYAYVGVD